MIKKLREIKSISQRELAKISGLSQSFLSSLENGQKSPTIRSLKKIANALDISPDKLFKEALSSGENVKSRGLIIKNINADIAKIYKGIFGKGPRSIKTKVHEDILLTRIERYADPLLDYLVKKEEGRVVFDEMIRILFNDYKIDLVKILDKYIKIDIKKIYYDHDYDKELIIVIKFNDDIL